MDASKLKVPSVDSSAVQPGQHSPDTDGETITGDGCHKGEERKKEVAKPKAPPPSVPCAECGQPCGYPHGVVHWPKEQELRMRVPTCGPICLTSHYSKAFWRADNGDCEDRFQFNTAMRFTDKILIEILEAMRTPGGRKLSPAQWQALADTERSAEQPADACVSRPDEASYYHVCCCWSVITMAAFMLARVSAQRAGQTLFYMQAVDQALTLIQRASREEFYEELLKIPSLSSTKRLPAAVLWHQGMRMKFSTTLQQPYAVQDVECTVIGFEPADQDYGSKAALDAQHCQGEHLCGLMPKAIYVKIDDCDFHFLPPAPCSVHRPTGHDASCLNCQSAVQPGVFAVKPLTRTFRYYYDPQNKTKYTNVKRTQFPLTPAPAMPLYSMQGTTADPGMFAYWFFPQRCSQTVKWLIVYVMLSRPRSLATVTSVGLTTKVRDIIEQGPPEDLVATFHKLFDEKIKKTKTRATKAAQQYGLLPGLIQ